MPQDFLDMLLRCELERLPNRKALGPNKIPNKVLKEACEELALYLVKAFTAAAWLGYYPRIRKTTTIVVLYKDGKADYTFINSYCLIALENTIVKIYKKLLVILIS